MLPGTRHKLQQQRRRAVEKAERLDGYREGTFRHKQDGTLYSVDVSFYPRRGWYISRIDEDRRESDRQPLTPDFWAELEPALKL